MRSVALALALALAGCGSDTTEPVSMDMAQPLLDIATAGTVCGANVCQGACVVCLQIAGGLCAVPCNTAMPSACPSGICSPAVPDGGNSDGVTFTGDCAGYNGFCS